MNDIFLKEVIKKAWNKLYSSSIDSLPWVNTEFPSEIMGSFLEQLKTNSPKPKILDFGCGNGRLASYFYDNECDVYLYDISNVILDHCIQNGYNKEHVFFNLDEINMKFDGILCWSVFHNIPNNEWNEYLQLFYNMLNDNGLLTLSAFTQKDNNYHTASIVKSEIIGTDTYAVEMEIIQPLFKTIETGEFSYVENGRRWNRILDYCIVKKQN